MWFVWTLAVAAVLFFAVSLAWRFASRKKSLPCPTLLAWMLDNPVLQRLNGTRITLERLRLQPGQRILEIGPGPGRLLIPASQLVQPGGEAVGIDIQPGMLERLNRKAEKAKAANLTTILGDASQPLVAQNSFDLVFLCTVLGEIPDRETAMARCFESLKSGGRLSITEMFGDPHYQSQKIVTQLAEQAGFRLKSIEGRVWFYTITFVKP